MSYKIIVKPEASIDIIDIKKWYRAKKTGLEKDFTNELKINITLIKQNPLLFQLRYNIFRAAILNRFPYLVYYSFENDIVYIHAVLAAKQDQQRNLTK